MPRANTLVAVVDDEESVRKALGRLIGAAGFDVRLFCSGADFLRATAQQRPDCVVLDVRMPHMDGFEIQESLQRTDAGLPVVVITSDDSSESRRRAFCHGARAYLRKPVDAALLLGAIESALDPIPGPLH